MFIKRLSSHRATSMVEMMITLTIFATVATVAIIGISNTLRSTTKIRSQVFLYTEAQALMDQLARYVERNAVDYETHFAREVLGDLGWHTEDYGHYAKAFYEPATGGLEEGPYDGIVGYGSSDVFTGTHPFEGIQDYDASLTDEASQMNAFCHHDGGNDCTDFEHHVAEELILVNAAGDERVIFVKEAFDEEGADHYISLVKMSGVDSDSDGLIDEWTCMSKYECTGLNDDPNPDDLTEDEGSKQKDFMPITPQTIDVEDFYVYLTPIEDPYRASGESEVQIQPMVTLVLTLTLSDVYGADILGDPPTITLQRTVSTGVYSEVTSWEP